ncbi:MAG: helix-turn-helix domain-containing protein [bacterium]|nr:helix-turn-helix domain-containing protein [bacterium]
MANTKRTPASKRSTSNTRTSSRPTSQTEQVTQHLRKNGHITSEQAFKRYGITRLSAVIFNLREDGARIENERQEKKNNFGRTVGFDRYVLANNY